MTFGVANILLKKPLNALYDFSILFPAALEIDDDSRRCQHALEETP